MGVKALRSAMLIFSFLVGLIGMEWVADATHKYLMHGPFWFFHKDHHRPGDGFFQRNDFFFLIFAIPSWLSIMLGMQFAIYPVVAFGFGVAGYGAIYVAVHELLIHRRLNVIPMVHHGYWSRVVGAHRRHHSSVAKDGCGNFGLLWLPSKQPAEKR